jgi:hypothetical protein
MSERRAFPRWAVTLDGKTTAQSGGLPCVIHDLSESGLGLACSRSADIGEELDVWWRLGPHEELETHCVVRDISQAKLRVEFVKLSRVNRLRILHYICNSQLQRADKGMS